MSEHKMCEKGKLTLENIFNRNIYCKNLTKVFQLRKFKIRKVENSTSFKFIERGKEVNTYKNRGKV